MTVKIQIISFKPLNVTNHLLNHCKIFKLCFVHYFFLLLLHKIFSMTFDITFIGYLAGFCTAIAQFPQAYKVVKTGDTKSISPIMYSIMTLGILFWFTYGLLIPNIPMIAANGVCLIPSLFVLYITIRNLIRTKKQTI